RNGRCLLSSAFTWWPHSSISSSIATGSCNGCCRDKVTTSSMDSGARLIDGLHLYDIAVFRVIADRLKFRRVDLKQPIFPLPRISLGNDGFAMRVVPVFRQRRGRSFHGAAIF